MSFTFSTDLHTDLAKVRFAIGDTNSAGAYLTDETITALITLQGSVGGAVIESIKYIITQLSQPDFRLDWMSVSNAEARKGFEALLKTKAQEYGISLSKLTPASTISNAHRADSYEFDDYDEPDGTP